MARCQHPRRVTATQHFGSLPEIVRHHSNRLETFHQDFYQSLDEVRPSSLNGFLAYQQVDAVEQASYYSMDTPI
jgi:hypothetical protein